MPAVAQAPIPTSETKFMFSYVYTRQSTGVFREDIPAQPTIQRLESNRNAKHEAHPAQNNESTSILQRWKLVFMYFICIYIYTYLCMYIYIQLYTYKEHVKSKPMHQTYQCNRVSGTNPPISKRSASLMDPKNQDWITLLWQLWMHKNGILHPAAKSRHAWTCSDFSRMILSQSWVAKSSPGITPTAAASAPTPFCFVPWVRTKAVAARKRRKNQTTHSCLPLAALALVPCLNPSLGGNKHMCKGQTHGSV